MVPFGSLSLLPLSSRLECRLRRLLFACQHPLPLCKQVEPDVSHKKKGTYPLGHTYFVRDRLRGRAQVVYRAFIYSIKPTTYSISKCCAYYEGRSPPHLILIQAFTSLDIFHRRNLKMLEVHVKSKLSDHPRSVFSQLNVNFTQHSLAWI